MANWRQFYGSRFLSAKLLGTRKLKGKILAITVEDVTGGDGVTRSRLCAAIKEEEKLIPLNATNAETLAKAWGDDFEKWKGKVISVETATVQFAGKDVDGLRVKPVGK